MGATMRMALIVSSISRLGAGPFVCVRCLAQTLQSEAGIDVQVLGLRDAHTDDDLPSWEPLHPSAFSIRGPHLLRYSPGLANAVQNLNVDLVHSQVVWTYPAAATLSWARRTKKPYLVTTHGMLNNRALNTYRWKKRPIGWLYANRQLRQAHCLHVLNENEAAAVRDYGMRGHMCLIPNGINLPPEGQSLGPIWKGTIRADSKVLLFLGRLDPQKGLMNLLKAWHRWRKRSADQQWNLALVGWDYQGHELELRRFVAESDLGSSVHFLGPRFDAEKDACLSHADAFVLPSIGEGLPIAVLEAWAYGLPVMMTPESNLPIGFDREAALRIELDVNDIARGIDRITSMNNDQRREMGAKGRQLVEEQFTWSHVAEQMRSVYDWTLGGGPPPACVQRG